LAFYTSILNGQMEECFPITCTTFSSEQENTFLQWTFKLNGAPAGAQ